MAQYSFAIVSDIHVKSSGQVQPAFVEVCRLLAALQPRFVVMGGDATVGNERDGVPQDKVIGWWRSLRQAMAPLTEAGIPILPIAGNHDYYTDAQRQGYAASWASTADDVASLAVLGGKPPLYYSFLLDDVYYLFLHVVDQDLESRVEAFAKQELASEAAQGAALRLAFGHVPLVSMMGRTNQDFCNQLGGLLAAGGVAAYFSGHEHLVWDQALAFGERLLRQVHVGTASGCYHFPLNERTYTTHCEGSSGKLPYTGKPFKLGPGTRQQLDEVTVTWVTITSNEMGTTYDVQPLALRDGQLVEFGC